MDVKVLLVASAFLLAGCASDEAPEPETSVPDEATVGPAFSTLTEVHDGTVLATLRISNPLGQPVEQEVDQNPLSLGVPEGTDQLLLEVLITPVAEPLRQEMNVRAVSASEMYHYGTGQGTEDDPIRVLIERPDASYDVSPVADTLALGMDYTVHATFVTGELPEDWSAFSL